MSTQASVMRKPVVLIELAVRDTDEIVDAYVRTNAQRAAQGFINAVEQAYEHTGSYRLPARYVWPEHWIFPVCASGHCGRFHTYSSISSEAIAWRYGA